MDFIPRDPGCCNFHTPGSFLPPWYPTLKMTAPLACSAAVCCQEEEEKRRKSKKIWARKFLLDRTKHGAHVFTVTPFVKMILILFEDIYE